MATVFITVDSAGDLWVVSSGKNLVEKLPAGASAPQVLPFTGLVTPCGVAVDSTGSVYVTDTMGLHGGQVFKLPKT
ncbi:MULTISPECIES: hypothetical protein [unclassified Mycobacterium]|uniref:hypothetical protein n=1 Tax=unclassified Mycobacterium TaxID=2642494 RepID=UPI0027413E47|nr:MULTISPECIES: hypothetical protein [unclassified Mycobacterium]MDP7706385.1 hypothetical protein [Mycobacterium sp. TY815]MDP7725840.1 hypothetical protein [Mycobacterium sp. TY814]